MSAFKKLLAIGVAAAIAVPALSAFAPLAAAEDGSAGVRAEVKADVTVGVGTTSVRDGENKAGDKAGEVKLNGEIKVDDRRGTTTNEGTKNNEIKARGENAATSSDNQTREDNEIEIDSHVKSLLSIADRDEGIGEEVRSAAHDYASSTERIDNAKVEVDGRPAWMSFIVGSDYKNLGAIRSELATTTNAINRLTKARDRATDPTVKAELDTQINALADTASTTESFVITRENAFSLFGWFFKLFNR